MKNNVYIVIQSFYDGDYEDHVTMFASLSFDEAQKEMMRRFIIHYANEVESVDSRYFDEVRKTVECDFDECSTYPDRGDFFRIVIKPMELGKVNMDY